MSFRRFWNPVLFIASPLMLGLLFAVACGGSDVPPVVVEKEVVREVPKEVVVEKEVIKEVPK
mgnify:CR=1 FL=1